MTVPGPQLIERLRAAAAAATNEATEAKEASDAHAASVEQLSEELAGRLSELAKLHVPDLEVETIGRALRESQAELLEIVERRDRRRRELVQRRSRLETELDARDADWQDALKQTQQVEAIYDRKKGELEAYLDADADYQRMQAAIDEARQKLEADESRLIEVKQEAKDKRPDFERDRLFLYLKQRRFGEPQYRAGRTTTRLDRWVARLIDYPQLKRSYSFLTDVPSRMTDEIKRRRGELDDLVTQSMDAIDKAKRSFGLEPLEADVAKAVRASDRAGEQRERTVAKIDELGQQIEAIERREGGFYQRAIERYVATLNRTGDRVLQADAAATSTMVDDDLVAEIGTLRERLAEESRAAAASGEAAETTRRIADDLTFIVRRAEQDNLATDRATFLETFDLEAVLRQHRKGIVDRSRVLEILKSEASIAPTLAEQAYRKTADAVESPTAQILLGTAAQAALPAIRQVLGRRR